MLHTPDPPICGFERLPTSPHAVFYDGGVNPPQTQCYSGNHVLFRQIKSKPPTNPLKTNPQTMPNSPMLGLKGYPQNLGCLLWLLTIFPSRNSHFCCPGLSMAPFLPSHHRRGTAWTAARWTMNSGDAADPLHGAPNPKRSRGYPSTGKWSWWNLHGSIANSPGFWHLELLWKIKYDNYIQKTNIDVFIYCSFCSGVKQRCDTFRNIDLNIHPDMGMNHFTLVPMHPVVYISKSYKNMCDPHIRKPPYTCPYLGGWIPQFSMKLPLWAA